MKLPVAVPSVTLIAIFQVAAAATFGPSDCIWIDQSTAGACLIRTRCSGQDTTRTDFAFDCVKAEHRVRHSFGIGSFDDNEDYNTQTVCDQCAAPGETAPTAAMRGAAPVISLKASSANNDQRESTDGSVSYGPENCVDLWRAPESGECIMKTDCAPNVDLKSYEFGLLCVDEEKRGVRHLFGKDSFAHQEVFNTLLKCHDCLALDQITATEEQNAEAAASMSTASSTANTVDSLAAELSDMREDMGVMAAAITRLNGAVFTPQAAVAPTPVASPTVAPTVAPAVAPTPVVAAVQHVVVRKKRAKHLEVSVHNLGKLKRKSPKPTIPPAPSSPPASSPRSAAQVTHVQEEDAEEDDNSEDSSDDKTPEASNASSDGLAEDTGDDSPDDQ